MRIGLIADTHDRLPAIAELVRQMQAAGVGMVLHAGDYCSPFAFRAFEDAHVSLAGVFGRNDGDRDPIHAGELQRLGYRLVVFGGGNGLPRAVIHAARRYLRALATEGTTQAMQNDMLDFAELQALLETERLFELGDRYAGREPGSR